MFNFKFIEPYTSRDGNFRQTNGEVISTPDGKALYGHRIYLNKILKDSGYLSKSAVDHVYSLVGDEQGKIAPLDFDGVILASPSNEFIYLKNPASYENLKNIISTINNFKGFFSEGDSRDFTHFTLGVSGDKRDIFVEIDLNYESLWVYQGKLTSDKIVHPAVLLSANLDEADLDIKIKDFIIEDEVDSSIPPRFGEDIVVADLRNLLSNCGIIRYEKKSRTYGIVKGFGDYDSLMNYIETINSVSYGKGFVTPAGNSLDVIQFLNELYDEKVEDAKRFNEDSEHPFNISKFLWNYRRWKLED